jgi:hypothetical protein
MDDAQSWTQFYRDGRAFERTARGAVHRPQVFTPEIIQNLVAMAIEKYFMAICLKRGQLPDNHTMTDLLDAMKGKMVIPDETQNTLLYMDQLQQICSVELFHIEKPKSEDVPRFMEALTVVSTLTQQELANEIDHS